MADDKLLNALISTLLIFKQSLILISESNNCMAEKTTYQCKLSLTEVKMCMCVYIYIHTYIYIKDTYEMKNIFEKYL